MQSTRDEHEKLGAGTGHYSSPKFNSLKLELDLLRKYCANEKTFAFIEQFQKEISKLPPETLSRNMDRLNNKMYDYWNNQLVSFSDQLNQETDDFMEHDSSAKKHRLLSEINAKRKKINAYRNPSEGAPLIEALKNGISSLEKKITEWKQQLFEEKSKKIKAELNALRFLFGQELAKNIPEKENEEKFQIAKLAYEFAEETLAELQRQKTSCAGSMNVKVEIQKIDQKIFSFWDGHLRRVYNFIVTTSTLDKNLALKKAKDDARIKIEQKMKEIVTIRQQHSVNVKKLKEHLEEAIDIKSELEEKILTHKAQHNHHDKSTTAKVLESIHRLTSASDRIKCLVVMTVDGSPEVLEFNKFTSEFDVSQEKEEKPSNAATPPIPEDEQNSIIYTR